MRLRSNFAASTFLVLLAFASDNGSQQIFCKLPASQGERFAAVAAISCTAELDAAFRSITEVHRPLVPFCFPNKSRIPSTIVLRHFRVGDVASPEAQKGEDGAKTRIGWDADPERDARTPAKLVQSVLDYLQWRSGSKWRPLSQRWSEERWYYLDGFRALNTAWRTPAPECSCVYCEGAPFHQRKTITFAKVKGAARA